VPRYFFHLYDDLIAKDEEGVELPNVAAARLTALKGARDVIAEQVKRGYFVLSHWIDVVDEQGEPVMTVTFRDAVDVKE
jgi:hypothetical protein